MSSFLSWCSFRFGGFYKEANTQPQALVGFTRKHEQPNNSHWASKTSEPRGREGLGSQERPAVLMSFVRDGRLALLAVGGFRLWQGIDPFGRPSFDGSL